MDGTLFEFDTSEKKEEFTKPKNNYFTLGYRLNKGQDGSLSFLSDDNVALKINYVTPGVRFYTDDGKEIRDGEVVPFSEIPQRTRTDSKTKKSGTLKFTYRITDEHDPAIDWDKVRFSVLVDGTVVESFERLFGGYPGIENDYNTKTGEFDI